MANWIGIDCKIDMYDKVRGFIEEFGGKISTVFTWKKTHTITATFPTYEQLKYFKLTFELEDYGILV